MRVLVMGATGFIGRALIPRLQCDGHAVVAWVRSPARARTLLGAEVELVHADTAPDGLVEAMERTGRRGESRGRTTDGRPVDSRPPRRPRRQPHRGHRAAGAGHGRGEDPPAHLRLRQRRRLLRRPRRSTADGSIVRPAMTSWLGYAGGGRTRPRTLTGWACAWCCCEPASCWAGPAARWRRCCRRSDGGGWAGRSGEHSTCRGFISTIS